MLFNFSISSLRSSFGRFPFGIMVCLVFLLGCTADPKKINPKIIYPHRTELTEMMDTLPFKKAMAAFSSPKKTKEKTIDQAMWVKLEFLIPSNQFYVLEIPNPNIDYMAMYHPDSSMAKPFYIWGDELKVSEQSNGINYPAKGLMLKQGKYELYLKYIHRGRFFHGSVMLTPQRSFVKTYGFQSGKFGVFAGICLFIMLLSSTLGIFLRKPVLIFYAIWSLSQLTYFLVSTGYLRLIFYPEVAQLNSILRASISLFAPLTLLLVIFYYLEAPKKLPKTTRVLWGFSALVLGLIAYALFLPSLFWAHVHFWLNFLLVCMVILYLAPIVLNIAFLRSSPLKVSIAFTSFSLHLVAGFYLIKLEYSNLQYHYLLEIERLSWLPIAELVIMAFGLGMEITRTIREKNQLLTENLNLQLRASEIHVAAIEAERKRIAADLHDHVLNRLDILSMLIQSKNASLPETNQMLTAIASDIRHLAYEIHPPWIQQQQMEETIHAETQNFAKVYGLKVSTAFYDWNHEPSIAVKTHILRITQEFLQNSQKHAQAQQIYINFFQRDRHYCLDFEDDGKGYASSLPPTGLGIRNVLARVQMMGGKIHIDSQELRGVHWSIEIPFESNYSA